MAMAAAAAAARRLFPRSPISPLGGLRLPAGAMGDEVRAGVTCYRYIHRTTARTPLRGPRLPAGARGNEVGALAHSCRYIHERAMSDAPNVPVTESDAAKELWKLRVEMKYYKSAAWILFSLFGGFVLSAQDVITEVSSLKKDVKGLKAEVKHLSEGKPQETHVHYHHCAHPPATSSLATALPSEEAVPLVPSPMDPDVKIDPTPRV